MESSSYVDASPGASPQISFQLVQGAGGGPLEASMPLSMTYTGKNLLDSPPVNPEVTLPGEVEVNLKIQSLPLSTLLNIDFKS